MRTRFVAPGIVLAVLAVMTLMGAPVLAQKSVATQVTITGTITGGTITRTIQDVGPVPNEPGTFRVLSDHPFSITVVPTDNATTIGTKLRDAVNTPPIPGYSSVFTTPSGNPRPSRPKVTRQKGGFNYLPDNYGTVTGVLLTEDAFTVEDAPVLPPVGLGFLAGALPALALWHRRRRKTA